MNSIYDIYESILDDIDVQMDNGVNDVINDITFNMIFDKDLNKRRKGFEQLLSLVESYHPKQHKTTAKMKNSDSYFIEFVWQLENLSYGFAKICDWISYIQICKRTGSNYRTVSIGASDDIFGGFGDKIDIHEDNWSYTQPNFSPKAPNTKLYEVPEELNSLFKQIQMEAYKHR